MSKFKVGDQVMLISGGPVMSVCSVGADGLRAIWFDGKKREYAWFHQDILEHASHARPSLAEEFDARLEAASKKNIRELHKQTDDIAEQWAKGRKGRSR